VQPAGFASAPAGASATSSAAQTSDIVAHRELVNLLALHDALDRARRCTTPFFLPLVYAIAASILIMMVTGACFAAFHPGPPDDPVVPLILLTVWLGSGVGAFFVARRTLASKAREKVQACQDAVRAAAAEIEAACPESVAAVGGAPHLLERQWVSAAVLAMAGRQAPLYSPGTFALPAALRAAAGGMGPAHQLTAFSTGLVVLFHYITLSIFSLIRFGLMHGQMPKVRQDDPSAGKAIGFMFIPFYNFYWVFFNYVRLVKRIDELRQFHGLPESNLRGLAIARCVVGIIPYVNIIGFLTLDAIFFAMVQSSVNELVAVSPAAWLGGGQAGANLLVVPSVASAPAQKKCPFCAELVLADAVKCRYCGSALV
jgi:hypothetical protein